MTVGFAPLLSAVYTLTEYHQLDSDYRDKISLLDGNKIPSLGTLTVSSCFFSSETLKSQLRNKGVGSRDPTLISVLSRGYLTDLIKVKHSPYSLAKNTLPGRSFGSIMGDAGRSPESRFSLCLKLDPRVSSSAVS
jgi:hypothetical protein